ncbi:DUF4190 domain-containing protein [Paenibacillus lentus]|uniref:DUF4190 domain-containing protein n=1 Tax=Paenibacillus lentus TaxID=1338368 RepID=A0A3Q8SAZ8_9BACL|nr:DUF4190 domain-containing protein [Paenibacillus lentus]AZK46452.1 DUF4190 domain-containing protein [Paenibacillus lentus]
MDYNTSGQYNYNYPPAPPQPPGHSPSGEPNTNGKSIVALVLGILAIITPYLGFFIGIIAIIFASLSFKEIKVTREKGHGLSIAGMVCGIIGTVIYGIIFLIVILAIVAYSSAEGIINYSSF